MALKTYAPKKLIEMAQRFGLDTSGLEPIQELPRTVDGEPLITARFGKVWAPPKEINDDKITMTFLTGTQLLCRKPLALLQMSCHHPPWWKFWQSHHCVANLPIRGDREAYKLVDCCAKAHAVVAALPSYKELEARDRRLWPNAIPCDCEH